MDLRSFCSSCLAATLLALGVACTSSVTGGEGGAGGAGGQGGNGGVGLTNSLTTGSVGSTTGTGEMTTGSMMEMPDGGPPMCEPGQTMCCGDGVCDGPETTENCAADCGGMGSTGAMGSSASGSSGSGMEMPDGGPPMCEPGQTMCCGDDFCDGPETAENCPADCSEGTGSSSASGSSGSGMMMPPDGGMPDGGPPMCAPGQTMMCCGDGVCDGPETAQNCDADC